VTVLPSTIRGQLAWFAVSVALPLVALIGYGLYDRARDDFAEAERLARRLAEGNADRAATYLAGLRMTLEAIARRPLIRAMDPQRCDPRLPDLVDLYPRAGSLIAVDLDGRIICSSRPLPAGRPMRIVDEGLQREMLARPRFMVSQPVKGRISGLWIVSAVQPVLGDDGGLAGTISLATDLKQWNPFSPLEGLPAGTTITIASGDGIIIGRSGEAEKFVGRSLADAMGVAEPIAPKEGVMRLASSDGTRWIVGARQVAGAPWYALAALPEDAVLAPVRRRLAAAAGLLALTFAVLASLCWIFVGRLTRPVRAIAEAVRARTEGGASVRVPVAGPLEVAAVAAELNRLNEATDRQNERLRLLHEIDQGMIGQETPQEIAAAVIQPLRDMLGVPRAIVNLIDLAAGEAEWLVAAGRQRKHIGGGMRFPLRFLGDAAGLARGEPQVIDTHATEAGPHRDGLLASGVHTYMAVPMIAGGELIGAISFGGERAEFPPEQVTIATEVATQLAIAVSQARLLEQIRRQAAELERRVAERTAALDSLNRELEDLYDNAPCAYHSVDAEGRIARINRTWLQWLGMERAEVLGRMHSDLMTPESAQRFREEVFPRFRREGRLVNVEFDYLRRDGSVMHGSLSATAVTDAAGNFLASRSTVFDVSERNRNRSALQQANARLEAANRELESFSYSVSHDLRAPLRAVDGYALMLEEDYAGRLDDEGRRLLGVVRTEAARMGQLIDDLLAFARTGRQPLELTRVDMAALARECAADLSPGYPSARLEIAALPAVDGDRAMLKQVWINLIANALKYSSKQAAPRITVGGGASQDELAYWVRDNGAGFDQRYAGKLFGVFQRLHGPEEFPGTGVGLAIVQRVIARHGGRVHATSAPGAGATFTFTLPMTKG
jgi:PAS domain S-box-containing protein